MQHDRWFLFNDAEVKPFDPSQIAAECFGGEMTVNPTNYIYQHKNVNKNVCLLQLQSKTYDSVTEKYLDFSFEKTNSAYMLFYERRLPEHLKEKHAHLLASPPMTISSKMKNETDEGSKEKENVSPIEGKEMKEAPEGKCDNNSKSPEEKATDKPTTETEIPSTSTGSTSSSSNVAAITPTSSSLANKATDHFIRPQLSKELEDWIWQDNRQFLQDRNIFEHTYFK